MSAPPRTVGRFEIIEEIARGGMGAVFRCRDPQLNVERAVKVLLQETYEPSEAQRFQREVHALARLQHPHVMQIFEAGVSGGFPFLVMPVFSGGSLADQLKTRGALPARVAAEHMVKVARGLEHAHTRGVVHRDLKPANILFDERGEPCVADFGIARDAESRENLTRTGQVMGTPAYMSPEQAAGEKGIGPATDIYAMGVVLYELLTARQPYRGSSSINIITKVLTKDPEAIVEDVPEALQAIVRKAMARRPADRYPSAGALAEDLERWQRGEEVGARSAPRGSSRLALAAGLGLGLGAVALAIALAVGGSRGQRAEGRPPGEGAATPEALVAAGRFADALQALGAGTRPEDLELAVRCHEALGSWEAAEDARWRWLASAPHELRALDGIVRAKLERVDCAGLARGWEELDRRIAGGGADGSWQRALRSQRHELQQAVAGGDLNAQLGAALRLQLHPNSMLDLEQLVGSKAPIVAEAARATLLGQGGSFAEWAAAAAGARAGGGGVHALTLLERAHELRLDDREALSALVDARGPLLRAALPMALALAATREEGPDPAWVGAQLDRLAGDGDPLVSAQAKTAREALAVLAQGSAPTANAGRVLSLALQIARAPERLIDRGPLLERVREVARQVLSAGDPPGVRLLWTRLAIEDGDLERARSAQALLGPGREAAELRLLLGSLSGERITDGDLQGLRGDDPVAVGRARRRLEAVREQGVVALPGPNGTSRIVLDLRRGLEVTERAFDLLSASYLQEPRLLSVGLQTQGHTYFASRFLCDEVYEVSVRGTHRVVAGSDSQVCTYELQSDVGRHRIGRGFRGDGTRAGRKSHHRVRSDQIDQLELHAPNDEAAVRGLRVAFRRAATLATFGGQLISGPTVARELRGSGRVMLMIDTWKRGGHVTESMVVVGRLSDERLPLASRVGRWVPLRGETPLEQPLAKLADGAAETLAELRGRGAQLRVGGHPHQQWISSSREHAEALAIPDVRGDFRIRATLRLKLASINDWHGAGIALWSPSPHDDVVFLEFNPGRPDRVAAERPHPVLVLRSQRGLLNPKGESREWGPNLHTIFYRDHLDTIRLEVERRGGLTFFRYGAPGEDLRPLLRDSAGGERGVFLQLDDPLRACLHAASNDSRRRALAEFSDVEVEVPAD